MPSYVTPKKNTAFEFHVFLEDQANAGLFKANPTLAAGDVKVATDDAAPANLATLPAVDADFTKRVKVSLSAGEMNGDNVTVIFSDAAGDEWFDLGVNIQTTAQQIDDIPTAVEIVAAIDADPPAVNVTYSAGVALTGRLAQYAEIAALISAGTGTGLYSETITVNDGNGLPLDGVLVQVATDSLFANVVRSGHTNNLGKVTLNFDAVGTYYGRAEISDFNVSTFTVTVS